MHIFTITFVFTFQVYHIYDQSLMCSNHYVVRYLFESCDPTRLLNNPLRGFTLLTTMGPPSLLFSRLLTNSIHRAFTPTYIVHVLETNSHRDSLVNLNNYKKVGDVVHCSPIPCSIGCH